MPARKPHSLNKRHSTKAEKSARNAAEDALRPTTELTTNPPAELKGKKIASAVWCRLMGLYFETQGRIVTAFDADILVKYCIAEEELVELEKLRAELKGLWESHSEVLAGIEPGTENLKDYFGALAQANALLKQFQGMDARLDGKRKMVFALAQSLYLTPRSRAGVAPTEKEPEEPKSKMDKLLG